MGTTPTVNVPNFNGVSSFSSSFQQVLQRAVAIAELPLQEMDNTVSTLQSQQSELSGLQTAFSSLESSIQSIGTAAQGNLSATVSDPSVVSASASSSALAGTYTFTVNGLGSNTTTLSANGLATVTDPTSQNISSASSFTLTLDGNSHTITPSGNTLDDLAAAINGAGLNLSATIVNVGTNSSPDYRLSVTSNNLAADTIQLDDGTNNLLNQVGNPGSPATYTVGGTTISSNSTSVTLAPGLTVNLLEAAPSSPVSITVGQNFGSLSNSVGSFVNAYNSALAAVNQEHGKSAGTLLGSGIVLSLGQALSSLTEYSSGSGNVQSLAGLGVTVNSSGQLSFNPGALNSLNPADVSQFLGGLTSGGFLQAANNAITTVADPSTGAIQTSITGIQNQITSESADIANQTNQINSMEANLQQQLSQADASIAILQQQLNLLSGLFATQEGGTVNSVTHTSIGNQL
jgi:flagellar hook-associated protein 2